MTGDEIDPVFPASGRKAPRAERISMIPDNLQETLLSGPVAHRGGATPEMERARKQKNQRLRLKTSDE
jgi:hypothetical protein